MLDATEVWSAAQIAPWETDTDGIKRVADLLAQHITEVIAIALWIKRNGNGFPDDFCAKCNPKSGKDRACLCGYHRALVLLNASLA